jgi:prolyl-tRNA editing enzyme YbaK/EbsC (Cys-tRNA(Pro) deacylase)
MQPPAEAFQEKLLALGEPGPVRETETSAHTAAEAASALGVPAAAIVKSLVFTVAGSDGRREPLLVLASGPHRVDTGLVARMSAARWARRMPPR